ncbi:MAG TPA: class I SAM-dependent methyltransferase [Terracidiphilus sp.]|nr:class I SAM-dependent methyltransferase [Terracidiphilus sp.]
MTTISMRHPYQGVLQILQFNRRLYVTAAMGILAALPLALLLPHVLCIMLSLATAPVIFWLAASLLVSHYVYDRYPLYNLNWIAREIAGTPTCWINVHCGFDETSALLESTFPGTHGQIVDIYDPRFMTEPSIERARKLSRCAVPTIRAHHDALPFANNSFDAAFCIFAAHELRSHSHRVALFGEIARTLSPGGTFILVEHARDWRNFLAFGPGFLHFFSPRAWHTAAVESGFTIQRQFFRTPFVRAYILRRAQ